jgi:hypothetical protein
MGAAAAAAAAAATPLHLCAEGDGKGVDAGTTRPEDAIDAARTVGAAYGSVVSITVRAHASVLTCAASTPWDGRRARCGGGGLAVGGGV